MHACLRRSKSAVLVLLLISLVDARLARALLTLFFPFLPAGALARLALRLLIRVWRLCRLLGRLRGLLLARPVLQLAAAVRLPRDNPLVASYRGKGESLLSGIFNATVQHNAG